MVRGAIESLYIGRCTITNSEEVFNYVTNITSHEDVVICENETCRLSYSSKDSAEKTDTVTEVSQVIKLFIRPELVIKSGSKITVTQHGRTVKYRASGAVSVYTNHQELILVLEDDEA